MASPPWVGVPTDRKIIGSHPFLAAGEKYLRAAVDAAGVLPVLMPALEPALAPAALLERLDGLLLTGAASNIEPRHYTDEPSYPGNLHDPHRDLTTLGLIPLAVRLGVPILAICRGFQEVNVAFGGSLHQKVHEQPGLLDHREHPEDPLEQQYALAHPVTLEPGGWLAAIADGKASVQVNSVHGQGVARLGEGLLVEATAPDGLIEAFRYDRNGAFVLAVQWHPEWHVTENPFYRGIFAAFGDACRRRALRRLRERAA